jgi:nucleoside-diphosphate-sugar epimerase
MTLRETYGGRRVVVTGRAGFKGARLSEWLATLDAEVAGCALDSLTQPNLCDALELGTSMRSIVADVRDRDRLLAEVQAAQPQVIFHLVAQPAVRQTASWYREYCLAPARARALVDQDLQEYPDAACAAGLPWTGATAGSSNR